MLHQLTAGAVPLVHPDPDLDASAAGHLGQRDDAEVLDGSAVQAGEGEDIVPARPVAGVRSIGAYIGRCGLSVRDVPGCHSSAPKFAAPDQCGGFVDDEVRLLLSGSASELSHSGSQAGACAGTSLCQKPFACAPPGKRFRLTARPAS
jgi:hypothetical protein